MGVIPATLDADRLARPLRHARSPNRHGRAWTRPSAPWDRVRCASQRPDRPRLDGRVKPTHDGWEWDRNFTTSLIGPGGKQSIDWSVSIRVVNGKVTHVDLA